MREIKKTQSYSRIFSLNGKVFGKLKVLNRTGIDKWGKNSLWLCLCECGKEVIKSRVSLLRKGLHSCGCNNKKIIQDIFQTHGMTNSNSYRSWTNMKTRCLNSKCRVFKNYGGRGIKICDEWINSFENFLKDMGNPKNGMTLERLDNEKGYYKENCKWIPKQMQPKNRRCVFYIIFKGKKLTAKELYEKLKPNTCYPTFLKKFKKENLHGRDLTYTKHF